jgi:hypothetical protein
MSLAPGTMLGHYDLLCVPRSAQMSAGRRPSDNLDRDGAAR